MLTKAQRDQPRHALGQDRAGYWRFLRRVYEMGALEAWDYIARHGPPPTVEQVRAALQSQEKNNG